MLHEWTHTECNLLGLTFFTPGNDFRIHPSGPVSQIILFDCRVAFCGTDGPRFNHQPGRAAGLFPVWGCYKDRSREHLWRGFWVSGGLRCAGLNAQECSCSLCGSCTLRFERNCHPLFQSGRTVFPAHSLQRSAWSCCPLPSLPQACADFPPWWCSVFL